MIVRTHTYRKLRSNFTDPDTPIFVRYSVFTWKLFGFIPLYRIYNPT